MDIQQTPEWPRSNSFLEAQNVTRKSPLIMEPHPIIALPQANKGLQALLMTTVGCNTQMLRMTKVCGPQTSKVS